MAKLWDTFLVRKLLLSILVSRYKVSGRLFSFTKKSHLIRPTRDILKNKEKYFMVLYYSWLTNNNDLLHPSTWDKNRLFIVRSRFHISFMVSNFFKWYLDESEKAFPKLRFFDNAISFIICDFYKTNNLFRQFLNI